MKPKWIRFECSQCKFYELVSDDLGACKADVPRIVSEGQAGWPMIAPENWCGRFVAEPGHHQRLRDSQTLELLQPG